MDAPGASVGALDAPDAPGGHRTQRGHLAHAVRSAHWARGRGACRGGRERRPGRRAALGAREPASTCAPGGLGACGQGRRAKAAAAPPLADSSSCGRWLTRRTPAGWRQSPCSVRSTLRCNAPLHDPSGRQARGGGLCGHGRGVQRVSRKVLAECAGTGATAANRAAARSRIHASTASGRLVCSRSGTIGPGHDPHAPQGRTACQERRRRRCLSAVFRRV